MWYNVHRVAKKLERNLGARPYVCIRRPYFSIASLHVCLLLRNFLFGFGGLLFISLPNIIYKLSHSWEFPYLPGKFLSSHQIIINHTPGLETPAFLSRWDLKVSRKNTASYEHLPGLLLSSKGESMETGLQKGTTQKA